MIFKKSGAFSENDKFVMAAASKKWGKKSDAGTPNDAKGMPEELPIPERHERLTMGALGKAMKALR